MHFHVFCLGLKQVGQYQELAQLIGFTSLMILKAWRAKFDRFFFTPPSRQNGVHSILNVAQSQISPFKDEEAAL